MQTINVPQFNKPTYTYKAELIRVIDGDTIDVNIDMGMHCTIRKRLRFLEVDTYELRGGTLETKRKANEAKLFVINTLEECKSFYVQTEMDNTGKYGRLLAYVWVENQNEMFYCLNLVLHLEGFHDES